MIGLLGIVLAIAWSVPVYAAGQLVCHATPMATGTYTAGHCLAHWTPPAAYSVDPVRDLAHTLWGSVPGVLLARPDVGEALVWGNERARGRLTYMGGGTGDWTDYSGPVDRYCLDSGSRVIGGDSGSGVWRESGELVGIVVAADGGGGGHGCGMAQAVYAMSVP